MRRLELRLSPLESMFFALTGDAPEPAQPTEPAQPDAAVAGGRMSAIGGQLELGPSKLASPAGTRAGTGIRNAYRTERRKLATQLPCRVLALLCVLGPFAFTVILNSQSGSPVGHDLRRVGALVGIRDPARRARIRRLMGISGARGSARRRHLLRRGPLRDLEDGPHPLVPPPGSVRRKGARGSDVLGRADRTPRRLQPRRRACCSSAISRSSASSGALAGAREIASRWCWPAGYSTCCRCSASRASRCCSRSLRATGSSACSGRSLAALVMQLLALVGTGTWVHGLLLASAFDGWHGLFTAHPFYSQMLLACIVSVAWIAACLTCRLGDPSTARLRRHAEPPPVRMGNAAARRASSQRP